MTPNREGAPQGDAGSPLGARQSPKAGVLVPLLWAFSGKWVRAVAQIGVMVVLARLLVPEEFGVVTAALVVVGFFRKVVPSYTLREAVVQREDLTEVHIRAAFVLAVTAGVLSALAAVALGPVVSGLFRMEDLAPLVAVVGLVLIPDSVSAVANGLLIRRMHFRTIARIDVVSYVLGYGVLGVALAFLGFGAWALIVANLGQATLRCVLVVLAAPHPVSWKADRQAAKDLFRFSGGLSITSMFSYFALHGDNLIVGRELGEASLGLYSRAYSLVSISSQLFGQVLDQVLLPVLSTLQSSADATAQAFRRSMSLLVSLMLPVSLFTLSFAEPIVLFLYGPGWEGAVDPLRVLGFGLLFRSGYRVSESVAKANGAVFRQAWRKGVYAALVVVGAAVGSAFGLAWVAVGVTLALLANYLLMYDLASRLAGLGWRALWATHLGGVVICFVCAPFVWGIAVVLDRVSASLYLAFPMLAVSSGVVYLGALYILPESVIGPDPKRLFRRLRGLVASRLGP